MPEQPADGENPQTEKPEGQTLGCIFSLAAVVFIVLFLFVFLRACA